MKHGFVKHYFPIQKVDNPEIIVDIEKSRIRKYWLTDFYCGLHKNTILELMGNELSTMTDKSPFKVLQTEDIANIGRELRVPNKLVKIFSLEDFLNTFNH